MKYRHEWKHPIDYGGLLTIRSRLSAVCDSDPHAEDGSYRIRSLYFDNADDKALREKIEGVNVREKFRIRYYNNDTSFIRLEKKSKINGLCLKESIPLTIDEAQAIVEGNLSWMAKSEKSLVCELYTKMKVQGLRPKTIVDYTREPFIYGPGNVRVTLDYNIRTGMGETDFLNPYCVTVPVGDSPIIMEVKWDEYLPNIIRSLVQLPGCRTQAFSKYAASRLYG